MKENTGMRAAAVGMSIRVQHVQTDDLGIRGKALCRFCGTG